MLWGGGVARHLKLSSWEEPEALFPWPAGVKAALTLNPWALIRTTPV